MPAIHTYELMLADKSKVVWEGQDGMDAARRYVGSHPDAAVVAFRDYPRHGFFPHVDITRIREPGDS